MSALETLVCPDVESIILDYLMPPKKEILEMKKAIMTEIAYFRLNREMLTDSLSPCSIRAVNDLIKWSISMPVLMRSD